MRTPAAALLWNVPSFPLRASLRRLPAWVVNGLTVTLGLMLVQGSIVLAAGAHAAQAAIATGVCASLADVVTTTDRVARRVLAAVVASTLSATLFLAARPYEPLWLPTVVLIVFCAMLIQSWGPKAGTVSFATTMSLVFAMSVPAKQGLTLATFAWGLVGSVGYWIWAVVTARLLQPSWRRLALASTAQNMAHLLRALAEQARAPGNLDLQAKVVREEAVMADQMQAARDLIFGNADGPVAHLQTSVLLRLADLRDLAIAGKIDTALARHGQPTTTERLRFASVLDQMAEALSVVADHVRTGRVEPVDAEVESSIRRALDELERPSADGRDAARRLIAEVLHSQLGHIRAIQSLHNPETQPQMPCRRADLRRYIVPDEWRLAAVRASLRPDSPTFRYAVRTAIASGVAYAISMFLPWTAHPQWVLLSVTVVMQGSLAQTLVRRNARVLGTLTGCLVVALLTLSSSAFFLSVCFLIAGGVAHAYLGVRYAVTAAAAAVMAVLQVHLLSHGVDLSILERLGDTVFGAMIGWGASYALPSWERRRLPNDLRQAMDAMRNYVAEVLKRGGVNPGLPRFARQRAYDAIRAVGAAQSRTYAEPSTVRLPSAELTQWLAAAYDLMSHLSNARLTLTLYAGESDGAALSQALKSIAEMMDGALRFTALECPLVLDSAAEAAIDTIPNLLPRLQDAFMDAQRVRMSSRELCALVRRR